MIFNKQAQYGKIYRHIMDGLKSALVQIEGNSQAMIFDEAKDPTRPDTTPHLEDVSAGI